MSTPLRPTLPTRGGVVPGTANRMRTGQVPPGTQAAAVGVALNTEVQVASRPVTHQGVRGLRTGALGPGRQVADASYYIGIVRSKVNEITGEIQTLKNEVEQHNRDQSQFGQYERKYENLLKEVRALEGSLADHNLAMDKLRTSTDPEDLRQYCREVEGKNRRQAQDVDQVFLTKQQREKDISDAEGQVAALQRQAEEKINQLEPRKLQIYKELVNRSNAMQAEVQAQQGAIEAVNLQMRRLGEGGSGGMNEQFAMLEKRLTRLQKDRRDVEQESGLLQMDPKEAQAYLLSKVKEDNRQVTELDQRCTALKEEIASKRRHLTELATDLADRRTQDSTESQKYEVLYKRDQEMTDFIDRFEENKGSIILDQAKVQKTIVALLEHISLGLGVENNLPSEQRFKEIKDEVSFKEKQLESSQVTMARLIEERSKRLQELEKLDSLDDKLVAELRIVGEKVQSMEREMVNFENIQGLKDRAENTQAFLVDCRKKYIRRRDSVKQQVQVLSSAYDAAKKSMAGNDTATKLDALEQKLKAFEQTTFAMKEFIETKSRQTDFQSLKDDCIRSVAQLNLTCRDDHLMVK